MGIGNTMNDGRVIVHGNSTDITGYSMRGGKIFIQGEVGYRVGIHMKAYKEKQPLIVIGGKAGDFFGEYMAWRQSGFAGIGPEAERTAHGRLCGHRNARRHYVPPGRCPRL